MLSRPGAAALSTAAAAVAYADLGKPVAQLTGTSRGLQGAFQHHQPGPRRRVRHLLPAPAHHLAQHRCADPEDLG